MMASQPTRRRVAAAWRTARRAVAALRAIHDEQVLMWELLWQSSRVSVDRAGPLAWQSSLDGPRLIDFGISRSLEATSLTRTGMVVGSPGFMSPEQAEGRPVGPASDVFSLGAVLTFAATGEGPFGEGSTVALLYRVVTSEPNTQGVPAEIRPLIERCLAKDPGQRPTAAQLLAQLSTADVVADPAREGTTRKSALPDAARRAPSEFAAPPYPATERAAPAYPATERAAPPSASRSAAHDQGPTLSPSEFQRAHDGHATEGERQWTGAAVGPEPFRGGLVADGRARGPRPVAEAPRRRRGSSQRRRMDLRRRLGSHDVAGEKISESPATRRRRAQEPGYPHSHFRSRGRRKFPGAQERGDRQKHSQSARRRNRTRRSRRAHGNVEGRCGDVSG